MRAKILNGTGRRLSGFAAAALVAAGIVACRSAGAFTLSVVDGDGNAVANYRWLVEEDNTAPVTPGTPRVDSPSLVIHASHAMVLGSGSSATRAVDITADPARRYVTTVIADGYQVGGANVAAGQAAVTVVLNRHTIPTSQISVLVFHDNNPINNAPDANEAGLGGFRVTLHDWAGGPIMQDVFGNPLGTVYEYDGAGEPVLDGDGNPMMVSMGDGFIYTDANGKALIKNLPMGKFGVLVVPPTGENWTGAHGSANNAGAWHQTATIEGTPVVDAWVKANEPMIFMEGFGPGFYHVFFGFVNPNEMPTAHPNPPFQTFANAAAITVPQSGNASPYPSTINVAGFPGAAAEVTLTLHNINHPRPQDLDAVLIGPNGQSVKFMSDVGGNGSLANVTLTFDDLAATGLTNAQIVSGTYRPSNLGTGNDGFPGAGTALSVFNGIAPNGAWSLYIVDDSSGGGGSGGVAGGWSLTLTYTEEPLVNRLTRIGQRTETNSVTVLGELRYNHFGAPPNNQQFIAGPPVTEGWVGLNEINALGAGGRGLYIAPCDPDTGAFSISNVPPGTYELVTWDKPLDALFGFNTITVPAPAPGTIGTLELGNVLSFRWFGTLEGKVFYDANQNGFQDPGENGIPQQALNLRFRDGTVYQATVTDGSGDYSFTEVFPFFKWLIAEVDFARFKPTGMTTVVDQGGGVDEDGNPATQPVIPADNGWIMPSEDVRNPQPQFETDPLTGLQTAAPVINPRTGNNLSRTELSPDPAAPLLLEAMTMFLNQNNRIDWGKANYGPNENGGIAGIAFYSTTRAENDPRFAVGEPWEPGIPRTQFVLYRDANADRIIDDLDNDGGVTLADIDNAPLGWADGGPKGAEDIDRNGNGTFDVGDAVQIAWADSWDDSQPTGTQQPNPPLITGYDPTANGGAGGIVTNKPIIGSDNYATWNQVREGVFDGGYLFGSYWPDGMANPTGPKTDYLPTGMYVVQACPPPGYLIVTEESKNVDFGDAYVPSKLSLPPECVGTKLNHINPATALADAAYVASIVPSIRTDIFTVAPVLSLFPDQAIPAAFAGQVRPLADMKWVRVAAGRNAACDFHMYTEVPKATRIVGFVLNDLTAEFNALSPVFGEKGSPGWIPVSFRDWTGREIARTYSDEYGTYNAMLPSTYTVNIPSPSGVAPQMLTLVLNDPILTDGTQDPSYNPAFATTPWTLHYYPGTYLYADTPIVPIAGFVGSGSKTLDVEPPAGTPVIYSVTTDVNAGPYLATSGETITITSLGLTSVPNPDYVLNAPATDPPTPATINRDFGFGASQGAGTVTINGTALDVVTWGDGAITATLPTVLPAGNAWQLMVTRDNGKTTPIGVTLTLGGAGTVRAVPSAYPTVQAAIDAAANGDLILVAPGERRENVILWKPVRLQGSGLGTILNANPAPADRLAFWHTQVATILGGDPFTANEAPGVMVLGQHDPGTGLVDSGFDTHPSQVDGFQIKGSIAGGGIEVWNKATNLRISNNRVIGNQGNFAGGITLGMQDLAGILYDNQNVTIEYNQILQNGGVNGGGGIAIYTGASGYTIRRNAIVGNFSRGSGGGISHAGLSPNGLIAENTIAFNEVFYGIPVGLAIAGDGGGIFITGDEVVAGGLGSGAGSLSIINNLILGNLAGAGHGGGIRAAAVNGADAMVSANPNDWYALDIINNVIVNNVAGYSAGGISLQDATRVRIVHNTIANNDCTATAQAAFQPGAADSTPQGAGIVSHLHSALLNVASGQLISDPVLENNILWNNRSFHYSRTTPGLVAAAPPIADLEVADMLGMPLNPVHCLLTSAYAGGSGNVTGDPMFATAYQNTLLTAVVADEAGNNISVRFEPTGLFAADGVQRADYHITGASPAVDAASATSPVAYDFDGQARPSGAAADIGADERSGALATATITRTAPNAGPAATGAVPPTTPTLPGGAGLPPGPMVKPLPLNPLPLTAGGTAGNLLRDPEPLVDSDGDGNRTNDLKYVRLSAGDGFARMGDDAGTELYTFGFADLSDVMDPDMVMMEGMLAANVSGPNIELKEGQHFYLDLVNAGMMMRPDLFDPHTVHFHGFPQAAAIFDGMPMSSVAVNMGGTLRYYYKIVEPGTYLYHCHVEASEHMQMGMIGNLYVHPKQNNLAVGTPLAALPPGKGTTHQAGYKYAYNDGNGSTYYDVEAPLQCTGFDRNFHEQHIAVQPLPFAALYDDYPLINGRGYPDTIDPNPLPAPVDNPRPGVQAQKVSSLVTARKGQRILLRLSNVSTVDFDTLAISGIPMKVVGKDARLLRGPDPDGAGPLLGKNLYYGTASVTLGGGESMDVILDTTSTVPGTYFVYSTRLNLLSNDQEDFGGMMTEIRIEP